MAYELAKVRIPRLLANPLGEITDGLRVGFLVTVIAVGIHRRIDQLMVLRHPLWLFRPLDHKRKHVLYILLECLADLLHQLTAEQPALGLADLQEWCDGLLLALAHRKRTNPNDHGLD